MITILFPFSYRGLSCVNHLLFRVPIQSHFIQIALFDCSKQSSWLKASFSLDPKGASKDVHGITLSAEHINSLVSMTHSHEWFMLKNNCYNPMLFSFHKFIWYNGPGTMKVPGKDFKGNIF